MVSLDTIIFDLEGVVIDSEPIWDEVEEIFLSRRNAVYDMEKTKNLMMGLSLIEGVGVLKRQYGFDGVDENLVEERRQITKELFEREVTFIDGFKGFFENVSKGNFKYGVATSLERGFLPALDSKLKLSDLFNEHIYSIADIGFISKPSPDIFLYAAKNLASFPANCVVIEDSPNGVEGAKKAGMVCIALTTSTKRENLSGADFIVDSYEEIKKIIV